MWKGKAAVFFKQVCIAFLFHLHKISNAFPEAQVNMQFVILGCWLTHQLMAIPINRRLCNAAVQCGQSLQFMTHTLSEKSSRLQSKPMSKLSMTEMRTRMVAEAHGFFLSQLIFSLALSPVPCLLEKHVVQINVTPHRLHEVKRSLVNYFHRVEQKKLLLFQLIHNTRQV